MIKTINDETVKKGQYYTTNELGTKFPDVIKGIVETKTDILLFVTIKNKQMYQNELHHDGLVHQTRKKTELVNYSVNNWRPQKPMHIFVRYFQNGSYLYLGELDYMIRYDISRHKLFIKEGQNQRPRVTAKKLSNDFL
jgi:hypothetical protein